MFWTFIKSKKLILPACWVYNNYSHYLQIGGRSKTFYYRKFKMMSYSSIFENILVLYIVGYNKSAEAVSRVLYRYRHVRCLSWRKLHTLSRIRYSFLLFRSGVQYCWGCATLMLSRKRCTACVKRRCDANSVGKKYTNIIVLSTKVKTISHVGARSMI